MEQFDEMVGTSPAIRAVFDMVRKVSMTDMPVLIIGEAGTGKELTGTAARASRSWPMAFLKQAAAVSGKPTSGYTPQAIHAIRAHSWPGNVREISNRVQRAVALAEGVDITPRDPDLACEAFKPVDSLDSLKAAQRRIEVEP